tara:strand:+ start:255 stop:545 length:291 start_codon:yes stop_codon:yes gene_type:complete
MSNQWLSTSKAAKHVGISPDTLKRWGRPKTGFLREGVHLKRGMKVSHPLAGTWNSAVVHWNPRAFCLPIGAIEYYRRSQLFPSALTPSPAILSSKG